jgi:hypothetical protein
MITCRKEQDGTYTLSGLKANDLDALQEGIIRLFDESRKEEHRPFRRQILQINSPIDSALDRYYNEQMLQRKIKF